MILLSVRDRAFAIVGDPLEHAMSEVFYKAAERALIVGDHRRDCATVSI